MRRLISALFPLAVLVAVALACANLPERKRRSAENGASPTEKTNPSTRPSWNYSEYNDEMGRGRVFFTTIRSSNTISLESPYEGAQHATLSIREHPKHGKDVYITIEKGQLLSSDYHGKVTVRFDSDKPLAFSSVDPADLSSETLFLRGNAFQAFTTRLKTAKTLRIEVPIYQAGTQLLIFDVEGFAWKKQK